MFCFCHVSCVLIQCFAVTFCCNCCFIHCSTVKCPFCCKYSEFIEDGKVGNDKVNGGNALIYKNNDTIQIDSRHTSWNQLHHQEDIKLCSTKILLWVVGLHTMDLRLNWNGLIISFSFVLSFQLFLLYTFISLPLLSLLFVLCVLYVCVCSTDCHLHFSRTVNQWSKRRKQNVKLQG